EQYCQAMDGVRCGRLERGDGGLGTSQLSLNARDVQVCSKPCAGPYGGQIPRVTLCLDVGTGDGKLPVITSQRNIISRGFCNHRDHHVALGLLGDGTFRSSRSDRVATPAEEIELPIGIEPDLERCAFDCGKTAWSLNHVSAACHQVILSNLRVASR